MGARARPAVLRRAGGTSTAVRTTSTSRSQRPTTAEHTAPLWPAPASPVIAAAVHASAAGAVVAVGAVARSVAVWPRSFYDDRRTRQGNRRLRVHGAAGAVSRARDAAR